MRWTKYYFRPFSEFFVNASKFNKKKKKHQHLKINLKKISANFFSGKIQPVSVFSVFRCQTVFKNVPILFRVTSVGPVRAGENKFGFGLYLTPAIGLTDTLK